VIQTRERGTGFPLFTSEQGLVAGFRICKPTASQSFNEYGIVGQRYPLLRVSEEIGNPTSIVRRENKNQNRKE